MAKPEIRLRRPVIQGTRVPVDVVVGQAAAGVPCDSIASDCGITVNDVKAAVAFAVSVVSSDGVNKSGA